MGRNQEATRKNQSEVVKSDERENALGRKKIAQKFARSFHCLNKSQTFLLLIEQSRDLTEFVIFSLCFCGKLARNPHLQRPRPSLEIATGSWSKVGVAQGSSGNADVVGRSPLSGAHGLASRVGLGPVPWSPRCSRCTSWCM